MTMASRIWQSLLILLMVVLPISPVAAQESNPSTNRYIVRLVGEPIALVANSLGGISKRDGKLDQNQANIRTYQSNLSRNRQASLRQIERTLGRSTPAIASFDTALNAVILELSEHEAQQIAQLPNIVDVQREQLHELATDFGPGLIGANEIHNANDTGIFAATLLGSNMSPSTNSSLSGRARLSLDSSSRLLRINITLNDSANLAEIIRLADSSVVASFYPDSINAFSGSHTLSQNDVNLLKNQGLFIRITTTNAPSQTIGGQISGYKGEGVVIGVLDSGINMLHPSFAEVGGDGYRHLNPLGQGNFIGVCDPSNRYYNTQMVCNNKLIGAWTFPDTVAASNRFSGARSPHDDDGHGSHTAATAAGNVVHNASTNSGSYGTISGVAPHANIIAYDVCGIRIGNSVYDQCPDAAVLAAIEQAIIDRVDVINYSILGGAGIWDLPVQMAFLAAREAGIVVSSSAGNYGPAESSVGHYSPWVLSVAATDYGRTNHKQLLNIQTGTTNRGTITGKSYSGSLPSTQIIYFGDISDPYNSHNCREFSEEEASLVAGKLILCDPSSYLDLDKQLAAIRANAAGLILINTSSQGDNLSEESHLLPTIRVSYNDGIRLISWYKGLGANQTMRAALSETSFSYNTSAPVKMASFSSRGPVMQDFADIIKPDLAAPGVAIIAADAHRTAGANDYTQLDGTSMAAPHVAGSAALLIGLHPDWTPGEVQSALMLTAHTNIQEHNNTSQANSFARGSGQIQVALAAASGLVLDETNENFRNAQHTNDLKALNLASMADSKCINSCTWTRTFRNTLNTPVQWQATSSDPALTISPSSFTIPAQGKQTLTFTFNVSNKAIGSFVHAQINLRTPSNIAPDLHLPVAVKPVTHNIELTQSYSEFSGTFSKSHNVVTTPINSIGIEQVGMTRTTTWTGTLAQGEKAVLSVQSSKLIYRLIAEIRASNANNLNLTIYRDNNNNGLVETSDTIVCIERNSGWNESCFLKDRVAGQYLIEVHNVAAGSEPNSSFELDWALVDTNNNNLTLSIPSSNPQGNPFTITEQFNLNSRVGDKWYGSYKLINNDTLSELARVDIDYHHIADQASVITILSGDQQQSQVDSSFAQALSVQISDQHGNPIVNERVAYASPASGASAILSPASFAITNQDGIATLNASANSITGSYTVTASLDHLQAKFRLSNTPGAAAQLAILSGDQQSAPVTSAFSDTLSVSVRDSHNNAVPNATVAFSAPSSGASAQLSSQTATTDANGIASINASANSISGSYSISATVGSQTVAFQLSNTPGAFASLALHAGNPQASTVGNPFAEPLSVQALDSHGNAIPNLSVQFAAPSSGPSAQLSSQTATTDANGIASINASANTIAGSYSISATIGSQTVAFQLSNNADSIASLVLLSGNQQSAMVSSAFSDTLSIKALDSYGNPIANAAIAFSVPSSGASASLDQALVSTTADGIATVQARANTIAGNYSVIASVGSQRIEFKLSNTPNSTIQIELVSGNQQSSRVNSAFAQPLQVRLSDSYGNPLPNLTVQFSAPTRGPSAHLAQLSATTNSDGLASVQAIANTIRGEYRISVSSGNASASFTLSNTGTILFMPQMHKN